MLVETYMREKNMTVTDFAKGVSFNLRVVHDVSKL